MYYMKRASSLQREDATKIRSFLTHTLADFCFYPRCGDTLSYDVNAIQQETLREKTFANVKVLWLFTNVSPGNLGGDILWWHKQPICKSFLHENRIFYHITKVFSLKSFPLYGMMSLQ